MKRIKLLHLITSLSVGGTEMMLCRLLERMDRSRFENMVACMIEAGPVADRIRTLGIPVVSLGMKRNRADVRGLMRMLWMLRRERPDILQTWLYHADLLGLLAGKIRGVPRILWNIRCANMDMSKYGRLTSVVVSLAAKFSGYPDSIVVNSKAGKKYHESIGYGSKRWKIIPNGFDLGVFKPDEDSRIRFRAELGLSADVMLIGLVARFDPMKDHDNFFLAARHLLNAAGAKENVHFILAGRGVDTDNEALKEIVSEYGLEKRVHLLGEREDIPFVVSALDIASSSSSGEGFPNAVGEAMACGIPCVVTDVGDSAWLVGDTGRIVPSRDPIALADAWRELICMDGDQRRFLGEAGRRRIMENFSIEAVVQQYEEVYKGLVEDRFKDSTCAG